MTFSLASLIFLIALGLVCVPTSVMAHTATTTNTGDGLVHGTGTGMDHVHPMVSVSSTNADDASGQISFTFTEAGADGEAGDTATFKLKFTFTTADGDAVIVTTGTALDTEHISLYEADGTAITDIMVTDVTALDNDDDATNTVANSDMFTSTITLTKGSTVPAGGFPTVGVIAVKVPERAGIGVIEFDTRTLDDLPTYKQGNLATMKRLRTAAAPSIKVTNVPRNAVVITEVGNHTNDNYDWIELTAIADTNLEKYELQYIKEKDDGTGEVVVLAQFVKKVLKAGEILVVLKTDPLGNSNHPIAAGKKWKLADDDREDRGVASLYHIDSKMAIPSDLGKALFVLRNEKSKTNHENIVDIAGNLFITDTSDAYRTNFWPLQATGAGHPSDVIKDADENFNAGRVYQRNDIDSGIGEKDWSVRGYTGIGYKRSAAKSGQNGGTPGFDNGALKDKNTVLTDAGDLGVSISEIMYDRGSKEDLVQWIELYNSSKTLAVNLDGWKLKIENADDVDVREPVLTIKNLGGTIIQPNQTVLIVAYRRARPSQSGGTSDFPAQRLIDLSRMDELEILPAEKRNYRLLSATAFKITLMEKDAAATAAPVDVAGNLGADGTAMWELPTIANGEGRSSIIRRYNTGKATGPSERRGSGEGMPMPGTMPVWSGAGKNAGGMAGDAGWILASASDLSGVHRYDGTYYGRADDVGTPGYRDGGPLPVSLSKFRPERLKETGEIVVRWITESELNNAGFNILRSEKRDGEFTKVHFEAGEGTTSERTVYEWKDKSAKPNVVYYYQIQDVSLDGEVTTLRTTHLRGNVTAAGKAATTWGEIKALQ